MKFSTMPYILRASTARRRRCASQRSCVHVVDTVMCIVNGLLGLFLTPKVYDGHYMNINLAHEMWKDLKVGACPTLCRFGRRDADVCASAEPDALHQFNPEKGYHWLFYFSFAVSFLMVATLGASPASACLAD